MENLINKITINKTIFMVRSYGLVLHTPIKEINKYSDYLELIFDNGFLIIDDTITIRRVKRPASVLGEYKFCYSLSSDDKHLGYICESIK
ncbi:MAG: hypothetical protein ACRC41_02975 [Sarcina sp.]